MFEDGFERVVVVDFGEQSTPRAERWFDDHWIAAELLDGRFSLFECEN